MIAWYFFSKPTFMRKMATAIVTAANAKNTEAAPSPTHVVCI
jgi:hypothetical protein